jgi:hypothetical protein
MTAASLSQSKAESILATCYRVHAVAVGLVMFLFLAVGTQGSHSAIEIVAALAAMLLQPVPMLVVGWAIASHWRGAKLLAMALPFGLAACLPELFRGDTLALGERPPLSQFVGYFCAGQVYNLPGATLFALVALVLAIRQLSRGDRQNHVQPHPS